MNTLVCCYANRYRSPIAEHYLRFKGLTTKSCGLSPDTEQYSKPPLSVIEFARELSLNLEGHVPHKFTEELGNWADVILCFTRGHVETLNHLKVSVPIINIATLINKEKISGTDLRETIAACDAYVEVKV